MKKMLAILMALLMAALLLPAYAEEGDVAEIAEIAGTVLEIGEESILLETPEGQLIEAILTADTIREGKEIAVGDFIHVMYNGQMTRSYPAQVTAQHIGCYVLTGTVSDITDEGFTLTTDETTYIVHATAEQLAQITDGAEINVYFSGVIAMSCRDRSAPSRLPRWRRKPSSPARSSRRTSPWKPRMVSRFRST